jgi:hypothetical protein
MRFLSYSKIMGSHPKYSEFTEEAKVLLSRSGTNLVNLTFIHSIFCEVNVI